MLGKYNGAKWIRGEENLNNSCMDVASYSQKMGADEEGTLKELKACREIIEAKVSEAKGRIFNTAGDAFMVEFSNTLVL